MITPATRTRRIELHKQSYTIVFNNRSGARAKCTLIEGEGILTLYKINGEARLPEGDPQFLSLKPGNSYYISLNTHVRDSRWEIELIGNGRFKIELPDQKYLDGKRITKIDRKKEYKEKIGAVKAK